MNIGTKIRELRKERNLTMKQLGKLVGISEQGIGNYERGDRNPNLEILEKISSALNVPIAIFFKYKISNDTPDLSEEDVDMLNREFWNDILSKTLTKDDVDKKNNSNNFTNEDNKNIYALISDSEFCNSIIDYMGYSILSCDGAEEGDPQYTISDSKHNKYVISQNEFEELIFDLISINKFEIAHFFEKIKRR